MEWMHESTRYTYEEHPRTLEEATLPATELYPVVFREDDVNDRVNLGRSMVSKIMLVILSDIIPEDEAERLYPAAELLGARLLGHEEVSIDEIKMFIERQRYFTEDE
jgi:hypothetical protein